MNELAIATIEPALANYTVFSLDTDTLAELRSEMAVGGNEDLGRFDMPRIKMPAQGMLQFIMPDGNTQKEITGIICAFKDVRVFYKDNDSMNTPPDCVSEDCRCGKGKIRPDQERAGVYECAKCPHNQWGSALNGSGGKACSERRILAIQTETGLLPMLLNLPVTSVKPIVDTMRGIISTHQALINNFILTLRLREEKNAKGIKYAVVEIDPTSVKKLAPEMADTLKAMRLAAKGMLDAVPKYEIASDDVVTLTVDEVMAFDETVDC
jgi:hypothetical protein